MRVVAYATMLVVTRKVGERIVIGDNVTLTVVRITGGLVRIGIEARLSDCVVVRKELIRNDLAPPSGTGSSGTGSSGTESSGTESSQRPDAP